jgi:hypothetical protein
VPIQAHCDGEARGCARLGQVDIFKPEADAKQAISHFINRADDARAGIIFRFVRVRKWTQLSIWL